MLSAKDGPQGLQKEEPAKVQAMGEVPKRKEAGLSMEEGPGWGGWRAGERASPSPSAGPPPGPASWLCLHMESCQSGPPLKPGSGFRVEKKLKS